MIVTAYHDDSGNILALIARHRDAPASQISFQVPVRSTEFDDPTLDGLGSADIHARLAQLKKSHRVDRGEASGRLIER